MSLGNAGRDHGVEEEDAVAEARASSARRASRRGGRAAAPRPHFTMARATRKATTIRRIVPFANPAYAFAGVRTPESTAMPTARTEAVRIGNAPTMTEAIVAAKIAKRCHAGGVRPSGTGQNQIADAEGRRRRGGRASVFARGRHRAAAAADRGAPRAPLDVHGAPADLAALRVHDVLPGEREARPRARRSAPCRP